MARAGIASPWVEKLAVISTTDGAAGKTVRVGFDGLKDDRSGKPVYIKALFIDVSATFATTAATMPTAQKGLYTRQVIKNIVLETVGGHRFLDGVDGDMLAELYRAQFGDTNETISDIPDADNAALVKGFSLPIWFVDPRGSKGEMEGALPVELFDRTKAGNAVLRFDVQSGNLSGFAGVVITNISATVWGVLQAREEMILPTPHTYRRIQSSSPDIAIDPLHGPFDFVELRDIDSAVGASAPTHAGYGNWKLAIDNEQLFAGLTFAEVAKMESIHEPDAIALFSRINATEAFTSFSVPERVVFIQNLLFGSRTNTRKHEGQVRITTDSIAASHTPTLYVRESGRQSQKTLRDWRVALGMTGSAAIKPKGIKIGKSVDPGIIPVKLSAAGSKHASVRTKLARDAQKAA